MTVLNFGQANALSSSLASVDDFVAVVRTVLDIPGGMQFLKYENIPDASERSAVLDTLDALVKELHRTREILGLEVPPVDVRRRIRHQAALLAAELGDMQSKELTRYGQVDPSIVTDLDAAVGRIISLLHQL